MMKLDAYGISENDDIAVVSQAMQSSGITATTSGQEQSGKGKSREVRERSSRSASPATRTAREGYRRRSPIEPTVFAFDPTGDDCPSEGDDLGKDWE